MKVDDWWSGRRGGREGEEEEEEGRFITMPPRSNKKIQKNQKLRDDLSPPSAPLSTPHLLPPSQKQIEVGVKEKGEVGVVGKK